MRSSDVINLVKIAETLNSVSEITRTEASRSVYASVRSVGQKEVYQAGAIGLKPSITFVLANRADYEGEDIVRHGGCEYRVLRTYFKDVGESIELICERLLNRG